MLPETGVSFHTEDAVLQGVWDAAEAKCRLNLRDFGGDRVLVEGGGSQKIWLETQPMGGEMYALRDLTAAKNNCGLFLRHQRADGRLPGSIQCVDGRVEPQFNKYQGFCFPWHALNLYYLLGEDGDWLDALAEGLRRFDGCLWRTRNLGEKACCPPSASMIRGRIWPSATGTRPAGGRRTRRRRASRWCPWRPWT